jgi:serine/threonine protein kinase
MRAEPWAEEPPAECTACGELFDPQGAMCPSCRGPLATAALPRQVAGKFRVERRIGRGGMGVVYRAVDRELQRPVAIKTLPRLLPERAARLRREARAMASVAHPNLALLYGMETWRGVPLLIEEYLSGGTLADRLRQGPLPVSEVLDLGAGLAGALATLHAHGLLHRDVKSSNVGYTSEGVPKLLDLGLAGLLQVGALQPAPDELSSAAAIDSLETVGGGAGTPAYMSPEAFQGLEPRPGFDLWGLAVVLFEALTGINPFRGHTIDESRARVLWPTVPSLRSLQPDAPPELDQLLREAFTPDPRRRPATATAIQARLLGLRTRLIDVRERLAV